MTNAPADWYPDPMAGAGQAPTLRYWDGAAWTEHTAPAPVQQPAAVGAYLAAQPTTPDGVPLAGWWHRVGASLIDGLILAAAMVPLMIAMFASIWGDLMEASEELVRTGDQAAFDAAMAEQLPTTAPWLVASTVIPLAYTFLMLRFKGATLGKLALGLRVRLRETDGQLGWGTIVARSALQIGYNVIGLGAAFLASYAVYNGLSTGLGLVLLLDVLWPLWDKKRQALHDKIAKTNVVKVR